MQEIFLDCLGCGEKSRHKGIGVKEINGKNFYICKCAKCMALQYSEANEDLVEIMLIISEKGEAKKKFRTFDGGMVFKKFDPFTFDGMTYEVRSIETKNNERVKEAKARDIRTMWVQPFEKAVSISLHEKGHPTQAIKITYPKGKTIALNQKIENNGKTYWVFMIQTSKGNAEQALVSDILALHARAD